MKREADSDDRTPAAARKLPRVSAVSILADEDASIPVSPTVAAGILPRASRTSSPAPPHIPSSSPATGAAGEAFAASLPPSSPLAAAREQLARASDAHVQARLLQQLSSAAAAPSARTNAAIDFLFSFLQSSQGDGSDGARTGGGPVVVGAIVRGLRELLRVKAAVVEPMIQVDAMGEQLMQCVSVAEDFKLRQDMLQIVVDCLMLTRAFAHVEQLLGACVRDHDAAMQAICVRGYVRLLDVGHRLAADPLKLFDLVAALLLHGGDDERVKLWAVRLLAALSSAHPRLDGASRFFPGVDPSAADADIEASPSPASLRDKAFFVLCMAASGAPASVRREVALSLREFGDASVRVVEHALQKAPISEEIEDDSGLKTVLMLASGTLLDLLEDSAGEVSVEASKSMRCLSKAAKWSESILDRAIAAHVDLLPGSASKSPARFLAYADTLEQLLVLRKEQYGAEFSLTSEEMNYIVRDKAAQAELTSMVAVLRILTRCDASTAWMVKRTAEYALCVADAVDKAPVAVVATAGDQSKLHVVALAQEIRRKCGAAIPQDVVLVDSLRAARSRVQPASGAKADVASILLGKSARATLGSAHSDAGSRSVNALFKFTPARSQSTENGASTNSMRPSPEYEYLAGAPSQEQLATGLKAIQRLRSTARTESEVSGLRVVELLLQLRQQAKYAPSDPTAAARSEADNTGSSSSGVFPTAMARGCQEIVDLACALYVKESQLSWSPRADLLQLVLLARVGLTIDHVQRQGSHDASPMAHWLSGEAAKLEFLQTQSATAPWLKLHGLRRAASLADLNREFASALQEAWPSALVQALSALQHRPSRTASAVVLEPDPSCKEPREIVAQWPFAVRVRSVVEHVHDISRVFVKSVLPDGQVAYARVPVDRIRVVSAAKCVVEHDVKLTVSPFSDPTSFSLAICVEHPALPGAVVDMETPNGGVETPAVVTYTEISEPVRVRIFHRTNSTVRRG